jgi:hypothetical protein
MLKNGSDIFEAIDVTWPAEKFLEIPKWKLRRSANGGKRVSAATAIGAPDISDIKLAENKMVQWHQDKLFMIKKNEILLDEALSASGYRVIDPTNIWSISSKKIVNSRNSTSEGFYNISTIGYSKRTMEGKPYSSL